MLRTTIRRLGARLLTAGVCLAPLSAPAVVSADEHTYRPAAAVPAAAVPQRMTSKELYTQVLQGTAWVKLANGSCGTGWVLDREQKLIVTNAHVVEGGDAADVVFPIYRDGKPVREQAAYTTVTPVKAVVVDRDSNRDLALLKLDSIPDGVRPIPLAAAPATEGDEIRTVGAFSNGNDGLLWGMVRGEVRTVGPQRGAKGGKPVRHLLSDAPTNSGNSGGAIVNDAGQLVAVHTAARLNVRSVTLHIDVSELTAFLAEARPLVQPATPAAFKTRGDRRLSEGRFDLAISDYSAALAGDDKLADALHMRAKAFLAKGDARTAVEDLTEALELRPGSYDFRVTRGRAYRAAGKTDEALADFSAAIRTDPGRSGAYNERGLSHFSAKNYADAAEDFGRAIRVDTTDPVLYANRADARMHLEQYDDAAADWKAACKLGPANPHYPKQLGLTFLRMDNPGAAAEAFATAVEASGGHPVYLTHLGDALRLGGKHEAAVKVYTESLKAWGEKGGPADVAAAHLGRGISRRDLKQHQASIDDLNRVIELTGGKLAVAYFQRGLSQKAAGADNAAQDDFRAAARLDPKRFGAAAKEANPFVGTWKGVAFVNGIRFTHVVTFNADGTFAGVIAATGPGGTQTVSDTGTYKFTAGKLTIFGKQTGTVNRTYKADGDTVEVDLQELGTTMTFARVK
ncbi:MAG: hhoB 1 [Gemmataceae bacterium]|nr:hhoB 1 [Gemmataceae bacterium]